MNINIKRSILRTVLPLLAGAFVLVVLPIQAQAVVKGATILSPKNGQSIVNDPLLITGLAPASAKVFFWYDGKLIGGVVTKKTKSGIASFAFRFGKALTDGSHTVQAQVIKGQDKSGVSSVTFKVPHAVPRRIDGVWVARADANLQPVGVMIENPVNARPQRGLQTASIVYETLAEGGVPRFLAIFAQPRLPTIGPVRSARPYYADLAKEYNAALMHAGGSRDAFNEIGRLKLRSVDGLLSRFAKYFFRRNGSVPPHNLFTDQTRVNRMLTSFGLVGVKGEYVAWKFKDDPPLSKRLTNVAPLTIDFGLRSDRVEYRYDRANNWYWRFNGGVPHRDATRGNAQIHVKNVVVQFVPKERVLDKKGHLDLEVVGRGTGLLLEDGRRTPIVWKKPSPSVRTKFYLRNGKEISFNRGNIWIEIVPKGHKVF